MERSTTSRGPIPSAPRHSARGELGKAIMILLLISMLATIVRFAPLIRVYSDAPANFVGGDAYFVSRILRDGNIPSDVGLHPESDFSSQIRGGLDAVVASSFYATTSLLLGQMYFSWPARVLLSFFFAFALSVSVLMVLRRTIPGAATTKSAMLIALVCSAGTPVIVNQLAIGFANEVVGWLLTIQVLYLVIGGRRLGMITPFMSIFLATFYFSAALLVIFALIGFVAVRLLLKGERTVTARLIRTTILLSVAWLAYLMYVSVSRFGSTVDAVANLPSFALGSFTGSLRGNFGALRAYQISTSYANVIWRAVNACLFAAPVAYVMVTTKKRDVPANPYAGLLVGFLLGLTPYSIGLWAWLGVLGLQRLANAGSLLGMLSVPRLLGATTKPRIRGLVLVCLVLAVFLAIPTSLVDQNTPINYVTVQEAQAADWALTHLNNRTTFFTDFRLSALLVSHGYLRVVGLSDLTQNETGLLADLRQIYYSGNPSVMLNAIRRHTTRDGGVPEIVFFSSVMSLPIPGVKAYDFAFRVSPDFLAAAKSMGHVIYDNGQAVLIDIAP